MAFKAALFDMDGLLFDSERIGLIEMIAAAGEQGILMEEEPVRATIGKTIESAKEVYMQWYPTLDYDALRDAFTRRMHALAEKGEMPLKEGVHKLLEALKNKGIPMAVASSSGEETIRSYLDHAGILHYFDVLVSGVDMPRSKPFPDIFLAAAQRLGTKPEDCLVLEDSYNGVKAGRAAGCTVCMVPDVLPYLDELEPYVDHLLPSLLQVIPLLNA
jgi:HAD superfamily hydrolase (TIGR01509 family)